jgi:hypothetical protein
MNKVKLDMNHPDFQDDLFNLEKIEQRALFNSLNKIRQLYWEELYKDKGLRWELIASQQTQKGYNLYSFRFSQKYRATGYRDGLYLVLLELHTDHDSTYQ